MAFIKKSDWDNDWCHICGKRHGVGLIDVDYPSNAEHEKTPLDKTVRICKHCIGLLVSVANSGHAINTNKFKSCRSKKSIIGITVPHAT